MRSSVTISYCIVCVDSVKIRHILSRYRVNDASERTHATWSTDNVIQDTNITLSKSGTVVGTVVDHDVRGSNSLEERSATRRTNSVTVNAQYTPPTWLNCRVELRRRSRRCERNNSQATTHDDCRRMRSQCRHVATRLRFRWLVLKST